METQSSKSEDDDAVVINRDDISNYNPEQILPESPEDIAKIRTWLQATDYAHESGEFHKHLASHMTGTGDWLTSSAVFQRWTEGADDGMLWIKGIPGSGKSVVSAHLINLLAKTNPGTPVLYFFFRQIIDANHEPTALLRDWLDQVLGYSPPLQKQLKELVEAGRSITSLSTEDFWGYLRLACAGLPGKIFCVADALDEMDQGNDEFLQSLAALGTWKPSKVKVLMTSRPVPSVEMPLRQAKILRIRLEEDMVDTDISSYVQRGLKTSNLSSDEQIHIREAIPGRANGIFLYAKLAMDAFLEPGAQIAEVLRTLPLDLHDMYTSLLRDHAIRSGVPQDIQLLILQWVTHATRPLRLLELAEMVSVTYKTTDLKTAKHLVRAAAGPLLEILPDETVCVIHHSFTEYLKCMTRSETDGGYPILLPGSTHCRLALTCLEYLQTGCLDGVSVDDDDDENTAYDESMELYDDLDREYFDGEEQDAQSIRLQYPFFGYAALNWHRHAVKSSKAGFDQNDLTAALTTFFSNEKRTKAWLKLEWDNDETSCKGITPLHIAARYGLIDFARDLVQHGANVDARDNKGKTPLFWAAANGHADIIKLLAQAGADPDAVDKVYGLKPLHEAANENHGEAVRVLLQLGVSPLTKKMHENPGRFCGNAPRSTGHTPLMYACDNGHLEALEAFLPFLTDIDTVHRALAWSAARGRSKLVKRILLHPGVDVNAKVRGDTALYSACRTADRDTIVALLEAGGDPTIFCSDYGDEFGGIGSARYYPFDIVQDDTKGNTSLHALCASGQRGYGTDKGDPESLQELFALLLAKGAKVDQRTHSDSTPLHGAVNNPVMVRLLLNAGADANAVDSGGHAPLHMVTSPDSVSLLIEEGKADINKIYPYDGRSPLLCMLGKHNKDVILKLLQYRPDLSIKDKKGNGALHLSLSQWSTGTTIIEELLAAGADPNERNRTGETPLLVLRLDNRESGTIVDLLLKSGADINAKNHSGMTLLSRAMHSGRSYVESPHADVTGLLEKGADLHVRDLKGKTLLHHAIAGHEGSESHSSPRRGKEHVTRFDFVMSLGLDVQALDYCGNTLIHELALRAGITDTYRGPKYIPLWNQLISLGIDVNQGNLQGRTALHMLAAVKVSVHSAESYQVGYSGPLDLVISKVKDVNQRDNQGLTALHLASTVSEGNVKRLLDAGSDPTLASFDGLTPLHLAARARQSNTVGLLLDFIKDNVKAINAEDEKGNTSLYYACRSGRPEIVQLLLQAGADASPSKLWFACAAFEDEQMLWGTERHAADTERNQCASGLTVNDTTRPEMIKDNNHHKSSGIDDLRDSARLEEIVDMLLAHNCDLTSLVSDSVHMRSSGALDTAASTGHTYTFSCLLRARARVKTDGKSVRYYGSTQLEKATVEAYKDADVAAVTDSAYLMVGKANQQHVCHVLKKRKYHVLPALFEKGVDFLEQAGNRSNMELLIEHGYASLLKEVGHLEATRKLQEGTWHAFGDAKQPGLYTDLSTTDTKDPQTVLLLIALARAVPNMDVVRLLVEDFHVDVNQRRYSNTYVDGKYEMLPQESALHYLAKGMHWWHTALAMPYLISKGADLDAKDYNGKTALHLAVGLESYVGPFHRDAAKILVAAGADVNTRDSKGHSSFANTVGDNEMFQLFINAGATISADAVFMAIKNRNADVLKRLLDAGADPNVRLEPSPTFKSGNNSEFVPGEFDLPMHELYPLYAAARMHGATHYPVRSAEEQSKDSVNAVQLVGILLAGGADPYATFKRKNPRYVEKSDKDAILNPEYEQVTLLHELLERNHLVHPLLSLDTLDPNHQDAHGRTVLHMACHKNCLGAPIDSLLDIPGTDFQPTMSSFLECLLARGADVMAVDSAGCGVLHHILDNRSLLNSERDISTLAELVMTYPDLLRQADRTGKTPLHAAVKYAVRQCDTAPARTLLDNGADAFAIDKEGNNCLHTLAFGIYRSASIRTLFTQLIGQGLDVNARNNSGETPLFNLNRNGAIPGVSNQLKNDFIGTTEALNFFDMLGADFFAMDNEGRGLLHVAAKETIEINENDRHFWRMSNQNEIEPATARFQALLGKGLDPMMEDKKKRTALDVAAACGKKSVLKLYEKDSGDV